ncbi:hypothetical protein F5Y10DRAFT_289183 [Nemania abortiva]|nr:hypothetical protein F5Y10DRAFT_289183 [Nemania abortiva]
MADSTTMVLDSSTTAAVSGAVAAAAGAARYRRTQAAFYRAPRPNVSNTIDTVSYMNHLRAPAGSRVPLNRGGVGVHIHYQGRHPHGALHGPSYLDGHINSHSENEACLSPQDARASQCNYYAGHPTSPCGCSQCYWRDFLTNDIEKYKTARRQLYETYIWNLRELYYVGRVREVYDNHCQHHRLLFRDVCLTWEMPEKVVLSEESVNVTPRPISRAPTPRSRHSSGGLRAPIPSTSRDPMPLSGGEPSHQWSMDPGWVSKGKEKVIPSTDGEVGTPVGSSSDDSRDKGKGKEKIKPLLATMSTETIVRSQPKPTKISMQQRLRQLWPTRVRGKSLDKTELLTEIRTNGEGHERNEQESVV